MFRRPTLVVAGALCAAFALGAFASSALAATTFPAQFSRNTYQYSSQLTMSQEGARYQVITLAANQANLVPQLHAANPNLKVLMYQSSEQTNVNDYPWLQTVTGCTPASDDLANHQDWILHDASGHLVHSAGNSAEYVMDIANPAFQQACAANAIAVAKRYGFDGVFWDVVNGDIAWTVGQGVDIPEYPNNTVWGNAITSELTYLANALHARHLMSIGNLAPLSDDQWTQWMGPLNGAMEESWTDGGLGLTQQVPFFAQKLARVTWAEAHHKYMLLHSYSTTEAGNTFGLAAMLLAARGLTSYSTSAGDSYTSNEAWFPAYAAAEQLGPPRAGYHHLANGLYKRWFANGVVVVNPNGTFASPAAVASGTAGRTSDVALPPTSAMIVLDNGTTWTS